MQLCVYLSNRNVQAVLCSGGANRLDVQRVYGLTLEEGCLINGVITAEEEFKSQLAAFWKENGLQTNHVTLVINSTEIVTKLVAIPEVSDHRTLELLNFEFADSERGSDPIYDYLVTKRKSAEKMRETLAVTADRSFVDRYVRLFASIGVHVGAVMPAQSCLVKLLGILPALRNATAAVQLLDGNMLTSILWTDGHYAYAQRTRLFAEPGSEDFVRELAANVSSLRQFYLTGAREETLGIVYVCGLDKEMLPAYAESVAQMELTAEELPVGDAVRIRPEAAALSDCVFAAGAPIRTAKDIDLYARYQKDEHAQKEHSALLGRLLPVALTLLVCVAASAFVMLQNRSLRHDLDDLNAYLARDDVQEASERADALAALVAAEQMQVAALADARAAIDTYPLMNTKVLRIVESCQKGTVQLSATEYYAENGQLLLTATAEKADEISYFVDRLEATGVFEQILHAGYTFDETAQRYNINVSCYLNGEAGR